MRADQIIVGDLYYFLKVLEKPFCDFIQKKKRGLQKVWKVKCLCIRCGKIITLRVESLVSEKNPTKSCGCYNRFAASQRMKKYNEQFEHGLVDHPLHSSWHSMKTRCYNSKVNDFHGGDIIVCDEWRNNFVNFYNWGINNGWREGLVLSRKDKGKNYQPDNCIFKTKREIISGNVNPEKAKQTCLEKYGVSSYTKTTEHKDRVRKTSLQKYGTEHPTQNQKVKDKFKKTILEKYGVENITDLDWVNEKRKQTCLEKYGVEYPQSLDEIKQKVAETCIERYGFKTSALHPDVIKKRRATCLKKYGIENPSSLPEIRDAVRKTCLERYGVESPSQNTEIRKKQLKIYLDKYGVQFGHTINLKTQNEIRDWLYEESYEFNSDYEILDGKEIDLYNRNLKLGIEYCGIYWHHELRGRMKTYHYNKYQKCKQNGIKLITIFSDEWLFRKFQIKNFILSTIGKFEQRIYARKCQIKELDGSIGKQFIEKYHIQGSKKVVLKYFGLIYNDDLVGVLSMNYHHRQNTKKNIIILDRLCFKNGVQVIGGSSKLFHRAKQWAQLENIQSIITWGDNRWTDGKIYEKMGFILDRNLPPDYSYVNLKKSSIRIQKQKMKKSNIGCPKELPEHIYAKQLGFARIWDCGKTRWIYNLS